MHAFSTFLRSGGDCGVDFQIPRNFPIRIPPKFIQIGALGTRILPFYDPGLFFVSFLLLSNPVRNLWIFWFFKIRGDFGVDFQIPTIFWLGIHPSSFKINQKSSISLSQKSAGYFRRGLQWHCNSLLFSEAVTFPDPVQLTEAVLSFHRHDSIRP